MLTLVPCARAAPAAAAGARPRRAPPPGAPPPRPPPRPPAAAGVKLCVTRTLRLSSADCVVPVLWKLRVVPGRFGSGMNRSSACAAGSIRARRNLVARERLAA